MSTTVGWIGAGRMGAAMASRLGRAGFDVRVWNRTRAKAEALTGSGCTVADTPGDLRGCDVVFTMVSTSADLREVLTGPAGLLDGNTVPGAVVDCSTVSTESSAEMRAACAARGVDFLAAPVSGNGKVVQAGKLSAVASGPKAAFDLAKPCMLSFAPRGVSYVGEGELSRICKIAHNVMLGVVIQNLAEITILAQKAGVPRNAFLEFMNNGVMGSMFTRYKSNAFVNLDWTTTFTPELLRKDLDLGLEAARRLNMPMPVTAATREALQAHFGAAQLQPDPKAYLEKDFAATIETVALTAGVKLKPENVPVPTGIETEG